MTNSSLFPNEEFDLDSSNKPDNLLSNEVKNTASAGQSFATLRESQGLSLAAISERLKFNVRQLQALEDQRWKDLPRGAALRGLIRSYARLLNTDPQPLLNSVPELSEALTMDSNLETIAHTRSSVLPHKSALVFADSGKLIPRWLSVGALGLFGLMIMAYLLFHFSPWRYFTSSSPVVEDLAVQSSSLNNQVTPRKGVVTSLLPPPPELLKQPPVLASTALSSLSNEQLSNKALNPLEQKPNIATVPSAPIQDLNVVATKREKVTLASSADNGRVVIGQGIDAASRLNKSSPNSPGSALLANESSPLAERSITSEDKKIFLRFNGNSWVQIRQADGSLLTSQLYKAGEQIGLTGIPPYSLQIGNARQVELRYQGKLINLLPDLRNDVTRLTLN